MITGDAMAVIESQYARLNAFWVAANTANALFPLQTSEQRTGNVTRLNNLKARILRLGPNGDLGTALGAGTITAQKWIEYADIQAGELSSIMSGLGEDNVLSRFWGEVVVATGNDVATGAKDFSLGAGIGAGAILAIVLLVVVLR